MREDMKKQEYQAQVLEQLQNKAADSTAAKTGAPNDNGNTEEQNTTANLSEEHLKSLVEQTLTQREKDTTIQQNLTQVDKSLVESFGTEAAAVVKKKAEELCQWIVYVILLLSPLTPSLLLSVKHHEP